MHVQKPATRNPQPATRNLPLFINKLLCRYQIPNTKYQIPNTKYQIPNTKYQIPNTKYQIPNTKYQILFAIKSNWIFLSKFISLQSKKSKSKNQSQQYQFCLTISITIHFQSIVIAIPIIALSYQHNIIYIKRISMSTKFPNLSRTPISKLSI